MLFRLVNRHDVINDDESLSWRCHGLEALSALLAFFKGKPPFTDYLPFVRGIHRSPVDSPHKRPVMQTFNIFFVVSLNKRLYKW